MNNLSAVYKNYNGNDADTGIKTKVAVNAIRTVKNNAAGSRRNCCLNLNLSAVFILFSLFALIICLPLNLSATELNENARASRISDSAGTSEAGLNSQILFQTDDFVFIIKSQNGEYEAAGPNNIKDPVLLKGMSVAAQHLNENPEFKKMLEFYKKSHAMRFEGRRKELNDKIKETEELLAKKKIRKNEAAMDIKYYNQELKKINETPAPPLVIVAGTKPEEKTSYMLASPLEFKLKTQAPASSRIDSKTIESPGYIMLQYEEFASLAEEKTSLSGLSVLAHETGHAISNNTTNLRNIKLDYTDKNPLFLVEENLKNDTDVVEFIKKGDPMPGSHWHSKVINSQTAFEEGFAEFTAAFFINTNHDGNNIADEDFKANKTGYRVIKGTNEVSASLEWSDVIKNTDELLDTEFFISKIIYRIAASYDDHYQAYQDILNIKASDEFIKTPDLNSFIKIFASSHPAKFEKFKIKLTGEINTIAVESTRRIQTDEKKKINELLSAVSSTIIGIGQTEINNESVGSPGALNPETAATGEVSVKYTIRPAVHKDYNTPESIKIKIMSEKIKSGSIEPTNAKCTD